MPDESKAQTPQQLEALKRLAENDKAKAPDGACVKCQGTGKLDGTGKTLSRYRGIPAHLIAEVGNADVQNCPDCKGLGVKLLEK